MESQKYLPGIQKLDIFVSSSKRKNYQNYLNPWHTAGGFLYNNITVEAIMKGIIFILTLTIMQANNLRLVQDYYDNRIPKKVYTYKESSNKLILKVSTSYYKTGQISYKVEYDATGLNSRKTWWHNNGNRSKMITFKNGQIDGVWITWSYDGIKTRERLYKNGSMINERVY